MLGHERNGCTIIAAAVALLLAGHTCAIAAAQIYVPDPSNPTSTIKLEDAAPGPANTNPVLFVHGHNSDDPDDGGDLDGSSPGVPNFRRNWIDPLNGLSSFQETLNLTANAALNIEPYYIRFRDQDRSIADDAVEIGEAVKQILHRHDPNYDLSDDTSTTDFQVVVIAYSKGTISTRLYLKNLHQQTPDFKLVSEFVAIAPPNHGLNFPYLLFGGPPPLASQQLNNGYNGRGLASGRCVEYNVPASRNFIEELNDDASSNHTMADSHADAVPAGGVIPQAFPSEAPGSRAQTDAADEGVLYVTLYAAENRDLIGGDDPPGSPNNQEMTEPDCTSVHASAIGGTGMPPKQGRVLARNLAPDAINISVGSATTGNDIDGSDAIEVHQNTVHTCDVIYEALYTAVHHDLPASLGNRCPTLGSVPEIPPPPQVCLRCFFDFCIRCHTLRLVSIPLVAIIVMLLGWRFVKRRR